MKRRIRLVIHILALLALGYHYYLNSRVENMIIPAYITSLFIVGRDILIAVVCGSFLILFLRSWITFRIAISLSLLAISIYGAGTIHSNTYTIRIPYTYRGKVYLFVSNEDKTDLDIDSNGIGYVTRKCFEEGFVPRIKHGSNNITMLVRDWSKSMWHGGSSSGNTYKFICFYTPGSIPLVDTFDHFSLAMKHVDSSRLYKHKF